MTARTTAVPVHEFDLSLTRLIPAPRAKLFRCWTERELIEQWFAPAPLTTKVHHLDLRPGGGNSLTMRMPDGQEIPCNGIYLEVVPDERLVFTDAYTAGWVPAAKPFMTAIITFEDEAGGTRYTARVRHWNAADRDAHINMGFEPGWGQCTDQLAALAARI